jgi:EAL domain-containing protein (putative c-di-GMP-specific phosphodiesterase class I)
MSRDMVLRHRELFPRSGAPALMLPAASRSGRLSRPALTLVLGAVATAILMALCQLDVLGQHTILETAYILVAATSTASALGMLARLGARILDYRALTVSVILTAAGMIAMDLGPAIGMGPSSVAANLLFVAGGIPAMVVIVPSLYARVNRRGLAAAGLDGAIMVCSGTTVLLSIWQSGTAIPSLESVLMPVAASGLFASAGLAAIAAFNMRAAPRLRGVWTGIVGVSILGLTWVMWADRILHGQGRDAPVSILYSVGIMTLGYAWMTWNHEVGGGRIYDGVARALAEWLPIGGIVLCVTMAAIPHAHVAGLDPAPIGTAVVVLLAIARQRLLVASERLASRRLANEVEERSQTMLSLARLERAETIEQTADRICDEALRLVGIETAGVYVFAPSGGVVALAIGGRIRFEDMVGEPVEATRATHMRSSAGAGAWVDWPSENSRVTLGPLQGEAFAPMRWDDRIVGVVSMGTTRKDDARSLADRLPTLSEFGVVSAAMLGPMLTEHWRLADIRSQLDRIIVEHAFNPVFQPVVQLQTREIIGFEALTRFKDGMRPDLRFMEADSAGMSVRLEVACINEQLEAATWLPPGPWVSLNVSPALASAVVPLISALERADRDVVLEITEHVEIADYRTLVAALDLVRGRARLAVDDAGAGYAGLRHILELSPQFVKLDISLVRNVDTDPARQAMVAGMAHFALNAGSELIAEGIETDGELQALIRLGISLGQGYLFGKPGPVS